MILTALKTHLEIYGHVDVPSTFVVPADSDWPKETRELKLGSRTLNIRYRGDFLNGNGNEDNYNRLVNLGFRFVERKKKAEMIEEESVESRVE